MTGEQDETRRAMDVAMGAAIRARMHRGDVIKIASAVGHHRSTVRYWLQGTHPIVDGDLRTIASVLETSPEVLQQEAHARLLRRATIRPVPVDNGSNTVSLGGAPTLALADVSDGDGDDQQAPGGNGDKGVGEEAGHQRRAVQVYRGYRVWGREDPRDPQTFAKARRPGRGLLRPAGASVGGGEADGDDETTYIFAVLVDNNSLLALRTVTGAQVGSGYRLFFDTRHAAAAPEGSAVAAMTRTGILAVGILRPDPSPDGTGWLVSVGANRQPCAREDIVGVFVTATPPDEPQVLYELQTGEPTPPTTPTGPHFVRTQPTSGG